MKTFETLTNRYKLVCTLLAEESLHFGSGFASTTTDAPFIQEQHHALLPGSGMRGALRARVESILRGLPAGKPCCVLFEDDNPEGVCDAGNETMRQKWESATAAQLKELLRAGPHLCPVCELFGSTIKAAKLKISDAIPTSNSYQIARRDGVGINRDTGRAEEHIKYDFEVLGRGFLFECRILLENAEPDDLALLYILISEWEAGVDMGGKKTRGLGRVKLVSYEVEWFDDFTDFLLGTPQNTDRDLFKRDMRAAFGAFVEPEGGNHAEPRAQ